MNDNKNCCDNCGWFWTEPKKCWKNCLNPDCDCHKENTNE